jgi:hypothetical protein
VDENELEPLKKDKNILTPRTKVLNILKSHLIAVLNRENLYSQYSY